MNQEKLNVAIAVICDKLFDGIQLVEKRVAELEKTVAQQEENSKKQLEINQMLINALEKLTKRL